MTSSGAECCSAMRHFGFDLGDEKSANTLVVMLGAIALVVSYFSGPILNFGDFSRYGKSFAAVKRGNFLGLPVNFLMFSLLAVITAAATVPVFGELITDPVETVARIDYTLAIVLGALTFTIATIGINIVANFISPAFDFSNVSPQRIRWRAGGMIAAVGSVLITPWNLYNKPEVIHTRLLPGQEAAHRHRRSVHHIEGRNLLVQAWLQREGGRGHGHQRRGGCLPGALRRPTRNDDRRPVQLVRRLRPVVRPLLGRHAQQPGSGGQHR